MADAKGDHVVDADESVPFKADDSKVAFINGDSKKDACADDVCINIKGDKKAEQFSGLTKEELQKYADDPFWVRVRWALLVIFWLVWAGMLATAIIIIVVSPKCPHQEKMDWWQSGSVYEIESKSLFDTDGDGVGDLAGVHEKLEYLEGLNLKHVWARSLYPSSRYDLDRDVTDFKGLAKELGTISEFENLLKTMHKKNMYLIMDFIPNHCSVNHTWFEKSRRREKGFEDFFIWSANVTAGNNDVGEKSWQLDDERQEYYYNRFMKEEPELNLRNDRVVEELLDVLKFWLDLGVDGFHLDSVSRLFDGEETDARWLDENFAFVYRVRKELDAYSKKEGRSHPRLLMVGQEGASAEQVERLLGAEGEKGAHMVIADDIFDVQTDCGVKCVQGIVDQRVDVHPAEKWIANKASTIDGAGARLASRVGRDRVNAMNLLVNTLPGTSIVYYGDEIAMQDVAVALEDTLDYYPKQKNDLSKSRDPRRTPMQWTNDNNAGFSTANRTWLPVADDFMHWNVMTQEAHGGSHTQLEVLRDVTALRSSKSMLFGKLVPLSGSSHIVSFLRHAPGFDAFLVAVNVGDADDVINLRQSGDVPAMGMIVATTKNFEGAGRADDFLVGSEIILGSVKLHVGEGIVVSWPPQ